MSAPQSGHSLPLRGHSDEVGCSGGVGPAVQLGGGGEFRGGPGTGKARACAQADGSPAFLGRVSQPLGSEGTTTSQGPFQSGGLGLLRLGCSLLYCYIFPHRRVVILGKLLSEILLHLESKTN